MPLNARQERFVQEYLKDPNATQAAIHAGYSEKTAAVKGCFLLRQVQISSEIERRRALTAAKMEITKESQLAILKAIRDTNLNAVVKWDGKTMQIEDFEKLTPEQQAALESLEVTDKGGLKLRLHGKLDAIKEINRMLGFVEEQPRQPQIFGLVLNLRGEK